MVIILGGEKLINAHLASGLIKSEHYTIAVSQPFGVPTFSIRARAGNSQLIAWLKAITVPRIPARDVHRGECAITYWVSGAYLPTSIVPHRRHRVTSPGETAGPADP
jgi:hypothetical protein